MHQIEPEGEVNFMTGIKIAQLALKHRYLKIFIAVLLTAMCVLRKLTKAQPSKEMLLHDPIGSFFVVIMPLTSDEKTDKCMEEGNYYGCLKRKHAQNL